MTGLAAAPAGLDGREVAYPRPLPMAYASLTIAIAMPISTNTTIATWSHTHVGDIGRHPTHMIRATDGSG